MMNININEHKVTKIVLDKDELIKHVSEAYLDIMGDEIGEMYEVCKSYMDIVNAIKIGELKRKCEEAFTMIVFPSKVFDAIEDFFSKREIGSYDELHIIIKSSETGNIIETITQDYLRY